MESKNYEAILNDHGSKYSSNLNKIRKCNSRFIFPDFILFFCFLTFVLIMVILKLIDSCTQRETNKHIFLIDVYYKYFFLRNIKMWFFNLTLIVFYDNWLHILSSVLFIKSSVFGFWDFTILSIRSLVFMGSFLFLKEKDKKDKEFEEYTREITKYKKKSKDVQPKEYTFRGRFRNKYKKAYLRRKQTKSKKIMLKRYVTSKPKSSTSDNL